MNDYFQDSSVPWDGHRTLKEDMDSLYNVAAIAGPLSRQNKTCSSPLGLSL